MYIQHNPAEVVEIGPEAILAMTRETQAVKTTHHRSVCESRGQDPRNCGWCSQHYSGPGIFEVLVGRIYSRGSGIFEQKETLDDIWYF